MLAGIEGSNPSVSATLRSCGASGGAATPIIKEHMKIFLAAIDRHLEKAWKNSCGDLDFVTIHEGSIFDIPCDAVVSPANSYGFMDGGIDALYTRHFGQIVQDRVRIAILERHHGELLVGSAEIVETDDPKIPYLFAAPTMRVPMVLDEKTVNPYLATRAVLLLARYGLFASGIYAGQKISNHVKSIAFPGMGTGVGSVPPEIAARQMRAAIDESLRDRAWLPKSWDEASERHQLLYTNQARDLQR